MDERLYYLVTLFEAGLGVFGVRGFTAPVEQGVGGRIRFFLPRAIAESRTETATEVRLVRVPPERIAALRFTGTISPETRIERERILMEILRDANQKLYDAPFVMSYDLPFSLPFPRRNEVAARLASS